MTWNGISLPYEAILKSTEAQPSKETQVPHNVGGRWIGDKLWWDINDESISDADLRKWIWNNLPEDSLFRHVGATIVDYHTRAYACRRHALAEYMKNAYRSRS